MYTYIMQQELITIVTVCFNVENTLQCTMESVLEQTYRPMEYILIDGQSTDRTVDIIRGMQPLFEEKKIAFHWQSEPDKGIFDAMNKGIRLATGHWINFMNAGDVFCDKEAITRLFAASIQPDVKVVYGDTLRQKSYAIVPAKGNVPEVTPKLMPACHQSIFADVEEMKSHPFDLSYRLSADYHFIYNLYKRGGKMQYVPVNVSLCEAISGVSSVHKLAVKRECARIRGIDHTLKWKLTYLNKAFSYAIKHFVESIIPTSLLLRIKRKNRQRLERGHHGH